MNTYGINSKNQAFFKYLKPLHQNASKHPIAQPKMIQYNDIPYLGTKVSFIT